MDKVRVNAQTGCWEWRGRLATNGYGQLSAGRTTRQVHRVTYEEHKGAIPEGLAVDHLCRNRICCNPDHLEAVTNRENWRRGMSPSAIAVKTDVCSSGNHSLRGDNLYVYPSGVRRCKACQKEASDKLREEKRLARIASGESRGRQADRTHCPAGHPYSGDNLHITKTGGRSCRACQREAARRHRERKRAELEASGKARVRASDRTECVHGHPYTEENTYFHPDGRRFCRTCTRAVNRKSYERIKRRKT
ncbi:HNH endonuclease signature motif containing protein [Streptomyces sp. NPDC059165]|uniref:HNH endonuclease signature motif containing protein n=1 Tax=Streptomyces sp. NPDC059165 TaxID=3346751 RepID=UPI0036ACB5D2